MIVSLVAFGGNDTTTGDEDGIGSQISYRHPAIMATTTTIGRMQEFNPDSETISAYLERFNLFVTVNGIEEGKQVSALLLVLGLRHYSLIRGLVSPHKPETKTLAELTDILTKHYDPEPIVIAERFRFYQRTQKSGESVADFLASLRNLASRCKFGEFLSEALRDRLVCGLSSEAIQKSLLAKEKLTLSTALETALGMEAAAKRAKELKGTQRSTPVFRVEKTPAKPCGRCGRGNHSSGDCKFKDATCHKCGKVGHIAPVCRTKPNRSARGRTKNTKWVAASEQDHPPDSQEESLFMVTGRPSCTHTGAQWWICPLCTPGHSHPYKVKLNVSGQPLTMEVDTGAGVSIASESVLASLLPSVKLQKSSVVLRTYTGEQIPVKGSICVDVVYGQQHHKNLKLLVVQGSGPSLMGRDWLKVVKLDWRTIGRVALSESSLESRVTALQDKYQEVFSETLGTITPFQAKLSVTKDAKPKFFKPRSIPFALRERVESELDRLESDGVIERTTYSEWAAPIVAVPKRDGRLRLCGDYKVTVNPVLDVDQYPLPKPDDIFATLSGGKKFTTLDLSHAYNQLLLDEDSRKYVTINTTKGLYQYTRLPFGIASAPAIFQRTMDSILQGIDGVACYIDDIIITGKTDEEHLEHLEEVLRRLLRHGVHVKWAKCRFLQPSVDFLGHRVDAEGIHTTEDKLRAIVQAPAPKNINELRSFLGLINYYGKFIPNAATILNPLNNLLHKDTKWKWSKECQSSFNLAKEKLTSSKVLTHYTPSLPIRMAGDASAYGIGAVIARSP